WPESRRFGGSVRVESVWPSVQWLSCATARPSCRGLAFGSLTLRNTPPGFRGPSPSTHEITNCSSRSVRLLSLANCPYPATAAHGGMWRRSTAVRIGRRCSHVCSYVEIGNEDPPSVWHMTQWLFSTRTISRSKSTVVLTEPCERAVEGQRTQHVATPATTAASSGFTAPPR